MEILGIIIVMVIAFICAYLDISGKVKSPLFYYLAGATSMALGSIPIHLGVSYAG
jgi:hypothetical protein